MKESSIWLFSSPMADGRLQSKKKLLNDSPTLVIFSVQLFDKVYVDTWRFRYKNLDLWISFYLFSDCGPRAGYTKVWYSYPQEKVIHSMVFLRSLSAE